MADTNWHPAQVQEARRLLCEAVGHIVRMLHFLKKPAHSSIDVETIVIKHRNAEACLDLAAAVLGMRWEDAGESRVAGTLTESWRSICDDGRDEHMAWLRGQIHLAHSVGLLTDDERELWERRIETCPGHDGDGGRAWCAYCGDLKSDES